MRYCQKCGTQIATERHYGTNYDQSLNRDFCSDCYKDGGFVSGSGFNSFDLQLAPMAFAYTSTGTGTGMPDNGGIPYTTPFVIDLADDDEDMLNE